MVDFKKGMNNMIPKYIDNLLIRRKKLAMQLMDVSSKIDEYCEKIGVDMMDSSNSVLTDVTIYCEPWTAYTNTKRAIEMALAERKHHNENKN